MMTLDDSDFVTNMSLAMTILKLLTKKKKKRKKKRKKKLVSSYITDLIEIYS